MFIATTRVWLQAPTDRTEIFSKKEAPSTFCWTNTKIHFFSIEFSLDSSRLLCTTWDALSGWCIYVVPPPLCHFFAIENFVCVLLFYLVSNHLLPPTNWSTKKWWCNKRHAANPLFFAWRLLLHTFGGWGHAVWERGEMMIIPPSKVAQRISFQLLVVPVKHHIRNQLCHPTPAHHHSKVYPFLYVFLIYVHDIIILSSCLWKYRAHICGANDSIWERWEWA